MKRPSSRVFQRFHSMPMWAAMVALTAAGAAAGLSCGKPRVPTGGSDGPILAESPDALGPDVQPGWKATLSILNTEIPVDVDFKTEGSDITLRLLSFDQEVEVERYRSTPAAFELVQMAGERFDPPLPLLRFPVAEGAQLPWKGKLLLGELERGAEAEIVAKKEPFKAKGFDPGESVRVTVDLRIDGGAPTRASRTLSFWFVKGKGLLKREIDKGSSRLPVPPDEAPEKS